MMDMQIFIDTANIDEIRKANDFGIIDGVTTNPSLISKENRNFKNIIQEIVEIIGEKPVNIEVISTDKDDMIKESIELSRFSKNIIIKIPITKEGLKVINILNKKNIKTNATLIFSANQALLAAKAGAAYISIFVGRLDDIGVEGTRLVKSISDIFKIHDINTEIIAASIRHPLHVIESAKAGAHISTVPFNLIEKMLYHPLTDIGIAKFLEDWKQINI